MRLINLSLRNFQGLRQVDCSLPTDDDTVIVGANESGKTTIANAITWLLTDKPYTGELNYSPKTFTTDGEMHNAEHAATAVYEDKKGNRLIISKIYKEIWTKKRGSTTATFSGHTTDYFVNEVPVSAGEYKAEVESNFGTADQILQLTVPTYFSDVMPWQQRRDLILAMSGDISDMDVIASDEALKELPALLDKGGGSMHTIEEALKIAQSRRQKITQELESIPVRIDELQRMMPEPMSAKAKTEAKKIIQTADKNIKSLREQMAEINQLSTDQQTRVKLAELRTQMTEAELEHRQSETEKGAADEEAIGKLELRIREFRRERDVAFEEMEAAKSLVKTIEERREKITSLWQAVSATTWDGDTSCPTCKRAYDPEQIEQAQALFNESKSKRLEDIIENGRQNASKEMLEAAEQALEDTRAAFELADDRVAEALEELRVLQANRYIAKPFNGTEVHARISKQILTLSQEKEAVSADIEEKLVALQREIAEEENVRKIAENALAEQDRAKEMAARIEELEVREKELATMYEAEERTTELCERFKRAKANLLETKINDQFRTLKVKLFDIQINGGLKDTCEVMIPSEDSALVPYKAANNAGRINAGLEIIDRLSRHYGVSIPVIVDNAESVNNIFSSDSMQLIRLEVAPDGTPLTLFSATAFAELVDGLKNQIENSIKTTKETK